MLHSAVRTTFPFRPWRLLAACLLSAAAVGALGAAYEYRHLGWSDAEAERRVADEVRREFDALTQELDRAAASVAVAHGLIARAARDVGAVHALFDTLDSPARRGVPGLRRPPSRCGASVPLPLRPGRQRRAVPRGGARARRRSDAPLRGLTPLSAAARRPLADGLFLQSSDSWRADSRMDLIAGSFSSTG